MNIPLTHPRRPRGSHSGRDKRPDESFQALYACCCAVSLDVTDCHWVIDGWANLAPILYFLRKTMRSYLSCKTFMENWSSGVEMPLIFVPALSDICTLLRSSTEQPLFAWGGSYVTSSAGSLVRLFVRFIQIFLSSVSLYKTKRHSLKQLWHSPLIPLPYYMVTASFRYRWYSNSLFQW